ncbi:MAG: putative nucleotidyltransferase [Patescibacteria group bacterium]|jgi:predicted nucleotidyltransferase
MAIKIKIQKTTRLEATDRKILAYFFDKPTTAIGLNALAQTTKVAKTTAQKSIKKLIALRLINKNTISNIWQLTANPLDPTYKQLKKIYNMSILEDAQIIPFLQDKYPNARTIILFGSYAKADNNENSDIDIAIEILGNSPLRIKQEGIVPKLGYNKDIPLNTHIYSRSKIDNNLFANIANGIILDGFLEVQP